MISSKLTKWIGFPLLGLMISGPISGNAEAKYPEKPIILVVPFGAGGGFDKVARKLVAPLEKALGVAIAIKNIPGSGGRRGSITLYNSEPDGYTIGFLHFPPFQADEIFFNKKPSVDYQKISIIRMIALGKNFIFVPKSSPIKTFQDFKNVKKPIKFTSTGIGSIAWVTAAAVSAATGIEAKFVMGYKSVTKAALAAARGDADAGSGGYRQLSGLINDIRPLVYLNDTREPNLPNVPTIKELGYPQLVDLGVPYIISAPPGTPKDKLQVIDRALAEATKQPSFVKWAVGAGYIVSPLAPDATWKVLNANADIYRNLVPILKKAQEN